jgi:hypothetical protein
MPEHAKKVGTFFNVMTALLHVHRGGGGGIGTVWLANFAQPDPFLMMIAVRGWSFNCFVAYSKMDESSAEVVWLEILSYGLMFFIV